MDYNRFVDIELINNFKDSDSIILSHREQFIIKGRIHQVIETGEDTLFDLYLQTGPEFLTISQSEFKDIQLKQGQGVAITVTDLKFYPVNQ